MQANIRQRLVGAFVLICLSAILWPVLFSSDINPVLDKTSRIPPAPEFQKFTVAQPQKPVRVSEVVQYQPEANNDQAKPVVKPEQSKPAPKPDPAPVPKDPIQKPEFTAQGLPTYWALQLGSFSQKEKAERLKQSLLAKGYKVDTRAVTTSAGDLIRVYVGPKLDKSILERAKKQIDKEFKVDSLLVKFTPE